jgi:hypothetical protein
MCAKLSSIVITAVCHRRLCSIFENLLRKEYDDTEGEEQVTGLTLNYFKIFYKAIAIKTM